MGLFFNRKKDIEAEARAETNAYVEIEALKNKTHRTVSQANRDIKKINDLISRNDIVIRITLPDIARR